MSETLLDSIKTNPPDSFSTMVSLVRQIEESGEGLEIDASVVFLRNFTLDNVAPYMKYHLLKSRIRSEVLMGEYDNVHQDLLDPSSIVHSADREAVVIALVLENLDPSYSEPGWTADSTIERLEQIFGLAQQQTTALIGINTFLPEPSSRTGPIQPKEFPSRDLEISRLNHFVRQYARDHSDRLFLVDWERIALTMGLDAACDKRMWYLAKSPLTNRFLDALAFEVAKVVRALKGRSKKVLVLDCDGTLWGGVVGEDGMEGLKLDPDQYPGKVFYDFQKSVLDLMSQGVAITLNSKNNLEDVWEVLDKHPHCLLKRDHLSAFRVNWQDKATNIRELAEELNLGMDSFVFIDDSGAECQIVRDHLPMVEVIRVPEALVHLPNILFRDGLFNSLSKSKEDLARTEMYKAEAKRQAEKHQFTNLDEFIKSLDIQLTIERDPQSSLGRVAQLTQKTNQFNLTTKRMSEGEVASMMGSPDQAVYSLHVVDKYGDYGLTGVVFVERQGKGANVVNLLLSCRVLGRGVEKQFLDHVFSELQREWNPEIWTAEFIATKKNSQVANFWPQFGFETAETSDSGKRYKRGPFNG